MIIISAGKFWMGYDESEGEVGVETIAVTLRKFGMRAPANEKRPERGFSVFKNEILRRKRKRLMRIPRRFALGRYPVTFEEYDAFCTVTFETSDRKFVARDHNWGRGRRPVIEVSSNDAQSYCDWLNQGTGLHGDLGYRLPSDLLSSASGPW